jgi:tetratricopeptide (TPR) repeat protein
MAEGKFDQAVAEADKAFLSDPNGNDNFWTKGSILYLQDDLSGAESEYKKLLEAKPEVYAWMARLQLSSIYLRRGNFEKAIEQCRQGIELSQRVGEKTWEADFRGQLFLLYYKRGDIKMAEAEVDALAKIAIEEDLIIYQIDSLSHKSVLYLEKKMVSEASKTAEEMKKLLEPLLFKKQMRWYFDLLGKIELQKNDLPKAIIYIENAANLDPSPDIAKDLTFLEDLGAAYFRKGDMGRAQQAYEKISSQLSSKWNGEIYVKCFYMLGRIAEQQGDKARAITNYGKFLDLWKDADRGIPEVEDAKKRLAGLTG